MLPAIFLLTTQKKNNLRKLHIAVRGVRELRLKCIKIKDKVEIFRAIVRRRKEAWTPSTCHKGWSVQDKSGIYDHTFKATAIKAKQNYKMWQRCTVFPLTWPQIAPSVKGHAAWLEGRFYNENDEFDRAAFPLALVSVSHFLKLPFNNSCMAEAIIKWHFSASFVD